MTSGLVDFSSPGVEDLILEIGDSFPFSQKISNARYDSAKLLV